MVYAAKGKGMCGEVGGKAELPNRKERAASLRMSWLSPKAGKGLVTRGPQSRKKLDEPALPSFNPFGGIHPIRAWCVWSVVLEP
jgi:hypothetical protein